MAQDWPPPNPPGWEYPSWGDAEHGDGEPSKIDNVTLVSLGDMGPSKVALQIQRVIQPALRENLGWTRELLAEALRGAPGGVNGHVSSCQCVLLRERVGSCGHFSLVAVLGDGLRSPGGLCTFFKGLGPGNPYTPMGFGLKFVHLYCTLRGRFWGLFNHPDGGCQLIDSLGSDRENP